MRKREWMAAAKRYERYCKECLELADEFDRRALSATTKTEATKLVLDADECRDIAHKFREESVRCSWNFCHYKKYKHNQNKRIGDKTL